VRIARALPALALAAWLAPRAARAHELTPALLALHERAPDEYDVLWRVPIDEAPRGLLAPVLPPTAESLAPRQITMDTQARYERWTVRLRGGVAGRELGVAGPPGSVTDALVRVELRDGRVVHGRVSPGGPPFTVPATATPLSVVRTYLPLGVEHILAGFDHLLFVLGLLLLTRSLRALVRTITAFTLAHSVTLVLAALDLLHVPQPPVEATIALSIVFVARELLAPPGASFAARRPWVVAAGFGLLHGLGFAGALRDVGLPAGEVPFALAAFNVGVELGQLAFVLAVMVPLRLVRARRPALAPAARVAMAYGIGAFATALCLDRVALFFAR
jgi:hydrogenase/urease accessory protein HupE